MFYYRPWPWLNIYLFILSPCTYLSIYLFVLVITSWFDGLVCKLLLVLQVTSDLIFIYLFILSPWTYLFIYLNIYFLSSLLPQPTILCFYIFIYFYFLLYFLFLSFLSEKIQNESLFESCMPGCVGHLRPPPFSSFNSFAYSHVPDTRSPLLPRWLPPPCWSAAPAQLLCSYCAPGSQPKTALASWGPYIPTMKSPLPFIYIFNHHTSTKSVIHITL